MGRGDLISVEKDLINIHFRTTLSALERIKRGSQGAKKGPRMAIVQLSALLNVCGLSAPSPHVPTFLAKSVRSGKALPE